MNDMPLGLLKIDRRNRFNGFYNKTRYNRAFLLVLVVLLVAGCNSFGRTSPPGINFTGVWQIDREMSGDPATLPGFEASGKKPVTVGGSLLSKLQSRQLRIEQAADRTVITYDGGLKETYHWTRLGYGPIASGWKWNHFVIRRVRPDGQVLIRRFILSDGGHSMTVVTLLNKTALTQFYERVNTHQQDVSTKRDNKERQ